MKKLLASLLLCAGFSIVQAQEHQQEYRTTYAPNFLGNTSETLKESSGLVFHDAALWSINDGGNAPILYKVDTAAPYAILQQFILEGAINIDWEALTQSETHFFIGDFGNNIGDRQDLKILKFPKTELNKPSTYPNMDTIKNIETIDFAYTDQIYFKFAPNNNNFDCEAFIHYGDSLYLFSKSWIDNQTKVYSLPTTAGKYKATLKQKFNTNFTVTDVSLDKTHNNLIFIGYHGRYGNGFALTVTGFEGTDFFSGKIQRFNLPHIAYAAQIEGVAFYNGYSGWIIGEDVVRRNLHIKGMLHSFDLKPYFDNAKEDKVNTSLIAKENKVVFKKKLSKLKNPIDKTFEIELKNLKKGLWYIEYFSPNGVFLHAQTVLAKEEKLTIHFPEKLNSGEYILRASTVREEIIYKINKQ